MREYRYPFDWFWIVGGERCWSSVAGAYVTELPEGAGVTHVDTEAELTGALKAYGLPGPRVLPEDVHAERDRRLALGFSYDFGDERGTHVIRTTPGDMVGWDEVSKWANVRAVRGQLQATLTIATGNGAVVVTADDWLNILDAATAFRQPIWGASFVLEAMNPIPADFREEAYWTPPAE